MIHAVHLCVCVNLNSVGFRKSYFPDLSMAEIKVAGFILLMISGYEFMGISCTFFFFAEGGGYNLTYNKGLDSFPPLLPAPLGQHEGQKESRLSPRNFKQETLVLFFFLRFYLFI